MSVAAMRAAIKSLLEGVDPLSPVHDYERWTNDPATYLAFFRQQTKPNTPLRGWVFGPESAQDLPWSHDSLARLTVWRLRFVYALSDEHGSEKTAWDLVASVQQALRDQPTLNGACWSTRPTLGPDKGQWGLRVIGNLKAQIGPALCHVIDGRLTTQE